MGPDRQRPRGWRVARSGLYDFFIELRDDDILERPSALWRSPRGGGSWEYWSTVEWAWRPAGERRRVAAPPQQEVLRPVSPGRVAALLADRQGWAEYWVRYEFGPDGERVPVSVIRRRRSPEETRCEFSSRDRHWISTTILSRPGSEAEDADWRRVSWAEADAVLDRVVGRSGLVELGRCGLADARTGSPFRYFIAGDGDRPSDLWRRDGERWEYFSVLEWGWFPESVSRPPVVFIGTTRWEGEAPLHPEQLELREVDAARARELEADRASWVRGYWRYWSSYKKHESGRPPHGIARRVSGARGKRDQCFPGAGGRWIDTDDVLRFPDYRASDYPWLEETDRVGATRVLEDVHDLTGVLDC